MHSSSKLLKGYLFLLISSVADATIPIIGKMGYTYNMLPTQLFFLRHLFAFIFISGILLARHKHIICLSPLVLVQGVILFGMELLFYYSLGTMPASLATIILYTYPLSVAVLAMIFFHEKLSLYFYTGLIMTVLGVAIMSGLLSGAMDVSTWGLIITAIASLLCALFTLLGQKTTVNMEPLQLMGTFSLICFTACVFVFPHDIAAVTGCNIYQISLGLAAATVNNLLGYVTFLTAITYLGATLTSLGGTLEPVIGVLLAVVLLHEPFTYIEAIGAVLVICGIIISLPRTGEKIKQFIQLSYFHRRTL